MRVQIFIDLPYVVYFSLLLKSNLRQWAKISTFVGTKRQKCTEKYYEGTQTINRSPGKLEKYLFDLFDFDRRSSGRPGAGRPAAEGEGSNIE